MLLAATAAFTPFLQNMVELLFSLGMFLFLIGYSNLWKKVELLLSIYE